MQAARETLRQLSHLGAMVLVCLVGLAASAVQYQEKEVRYESASQIRHRLLAGW